MNPNNDLEKYEIANVFKEKNEEEILWSTSHLAPNYGENIDECKDSDKKE